MKKIVKCYFVILLYPILYFPYKALNYFVIVDWLGCSCDNPGFNANHFTNIFWIVVGICTLLFFIRNFLKFFQLSSKKKIIFFISSIVCLVIYATLMTVCFANSMYWD